jgi:hypothetical protein
LAAYGSNTLPLAFGMTPEEASPRWAQLVYYANSGSEIYLAYGSAGVPGFIPPTP